MASKDRNSYDHVLKYVGIFGGVQGLSILVGLVRNKVVAYFLGPYGMGLVSLFNSTINFISQSTNLGISFSAVKHVSELFDSGDEERIQHFVKVVRAWSLLTALIGMLVCVAAGPLMNHTFSWGDHTLHFVLLAPAVGLMAVTGGEMAILKGCRRLRALALIQVINVFVALILAAAVFSTFGQAGIVPVIVLMAFVMMLTTIWYSYKLFPFRLRGSHGILGEGLGMVRLGVAFVVAGILGSGAEILIRAYLNRTGDLGAVGFYNAGLMIAVTYSGMVFSAMETDYFPRLSAVGNDRRQMCDMVNRQIEVSLLIASPLLALLIVLMPIVIPLLFTDAFLPVIAMAQVAVLSMYFKAISLPIAYLQLVKANSVGYLLLEGLFDVLMVLFVMVGYHYWGLIGTGVALSLSYFANVLMVYAYAHVKYGYRISLPVIQLIAIQIPLGIAVYITTWLDNAWVAWGIGIILAFVSVAVSVNIVHQKTGLWIALKEKISSKLKRHG
jgi:O-antigen/teichoic acid export membrane protein